jgi:hypothetical protein
MAAFSGSAQDTTTPSVFSAVIPGWYDNQTNNGVNANASYIYHFNLHVISTLRYNYSRASQPPNALLLQPPEWQRGRQSRNRRHRSISGQLGTSHHQLYGSSLLGITDTTLLYQHPQTSAVGDTVALGEGRPPIPVRRRFQPAPDESAQPEPIRAELCNSTAL